MSTQDDQLDSLLQRFLFHQQTTVRLLDEIGKDDYQTQFHPDLSPIGWHVGHCVFTETYWVQEAWLQRHICDDALRSLYTPELSSKSIRGQHLPEFAQLKHWAEEIQASNLRLIKDNASSDHHLMNHHFLIAFLNQHYSQHYETVQMSLQQKALQQNYDYQPEHELQTTTSDPRIVNIEQGSYDIGTNQGEMVYYDNELPAHPVQLEPFAIAQQPVTNSEFLAFINDSGYARPEFWPVKALSWLQQNPCCHPLHWRQTSVGAWFQITNNGPADLLADEPVCGINWFEANAYANWVGARLPHEYEWETASKQQCIHNTGQVWEWCHNHFHPYPQFKPYPYDGYSAPYFDGKHYTLKGGSMWTREEIKRPAFRNYYQADKRHIFAGLRLVFDH